MCNMINDNYFLLHFQNCDSYEARLKTLGRSTSGEEEASRRRQLSPSDGDRYRYSLANLNISFKIVKFTILAI